MSEEPRVIKRPDGSFVIKGIDQSQPRGVIGPFHFFDQARASMRRLGFEAFCVQSNEWDALLERLKSKGIKLNGEDII